MLETSNFFSKPPNHLVTDRLNQIPELSRFFQPHLYKKKKPTNPLSFPKKNFTIKQNFKKSEYTQRFQLKKKMDVRMMGYGNPLFTALQHALNSSEEADKSHHGPTRTYVQDAKAMAATPADVKEYPNSYHFVIDMPGLKSGDIKVQIEDDNMIVISGERKREEEKEGAKYVRMERRIGKFMRKFALPENANIDKISAVCQDGVLHVTVEKIPPPEPKKPRTIEVKIA